MLRYRTGRVGEGTISQRLRGHTNFSQLGSWRPNLFQGLNSDLLSVSGTENTHAQNVLNKKSGIYTVYAVIHSLCCTAAVAVHPDCSIDEAVSITMYRRYGVALSWVDM
jgi:hypothetical protein